MGRSLGRSSRKSATYVAGDYKLKIEKVSLVGAFGIRVTLFRRGRRISVWPKDGWKQYKEGMDPTLVTRDVVRFVRFPRLNVGKLNKRVRNLLS